MNDAAKFLLLVFSNLALIALVAFIATPAIFVPGEKLWQPAKLENAANLVPCIEGEKTSCTNSQGCTGYRVCKGGQWGVCIVKVICAPGSRIGCFVSSCGMGHAVCNACGTAYENCAPP